MGPKHNFLKTAGSSLGIQHSEETKAKLREINLGKLLVNPIEQL